MTSKIIPTDLACHDLAVSFANGDLAFCILDVLYQDLAPSWRYGFGCSPSPTNNRFLGKTNPHISWHQKNVVSYPKKATVKGEKFNPQAGTVACSTVSCSLTRSHFVMWGWIAWWFSSGIALEKDGSYIVFHLSGSRDILMRSIWQARKCMPWS